jgi:hypothetical protein
MVPEPEKDHFADLPEVQKDEHKGVKYDHEKGDMFKGERGEEEKEKKEEYQYLDDRSSDD